MSTAEAGRRLLDVAESLKGRFWSLKSVDDALARQLSAKAGGSDLIGRLLATRGVMPDEVETFLAPTLKATFPDPSSFQDMDRAAELTLDALVNARPVVCFADYDVDGGTASAILTRYFRAWGLDLGLYVPDRLKEGYGPSPEAFRHLKETGAELVITVDCGAAARAALEEAAKIDLPVIVLDHHLMQGDLPPAAALVNPNRGDDTSGHGHLAGAGVAFVFAVAVNRLAKAQQIAPPSGLPDLMQWLDLAALGTLCDMAALKGVNRAFARQGLKIMSAGRNAGIRALADVAGIGQINSVYHATFVLGPRLNAGGRVGDPWLAARLLAADECGEALALAERLHGLNDQRKAVEAAILDEATAQAQRQLQANPDQAALIAAGEGWHPGVIGIVAGRLKDKFHLPCVCIGWGEGLGPVAKGSARSVRGVNIGNAIAQAAREGVILSGGGHAMAGGLSLSPEQVPAFADWLNTHVAVFRNELSAARELEIDAVMAAGTGTPDFVDEVERLGPFGVGAPQPVFVLSDVHISGARRVGVNHVRFSAEDGTGRLDGIAWRCADEPLGEALLRSEKLHIAGRLKADEWNGRRRVQLELVDAAIADRQKLG